MKADDKLFELHEKLLSLDKASREAQNATSRQHEVKTTPLFSYQVRDVVDEGSAVKSFPQHCLLAGDLLVLGIEPPIPKTSDKGTLTPESSGAESSGVNILAPETLEQRPSKIDPRIFLNVNAPWSAFVCGSQGSGKSYTLSCMLEACLKAAPQLGNLLPNPLAGLVFHYDKHSGSAGAVCEAAYLSSHGIPVTVLVSGSNENKMRRFYEGMNLPKGKQPKVQVLKFKNRHINIQRMMSLMCVSTEGKRPLYIEAVTKILRDMATNSSMEGIEYSRFLAKIDGLKLAPDQQRPLRQRLDILESFLEGRWVAGKGGKQVWEALSKESEDLWIPKPGNLTIVDLSSPFIDESSACALFSICLSLFLENNSVANSQNGSSKKGKGKSSHSPVGKVVALDEAHKYMTSTTGSNAFTDSLLDTIRMQRHYGVRTIIATQEPTIAPALMDLSSITLIHRFSSRQWMATIKNHLTLRDVSQKEEESIAERRTMDEIENLATGEALLFCNTALLSVCEKDGRKAKKMGGGWKKVRIRKRVTNDGGMSKMAS